MGRTALPLKNVQNLYSLNKPARFLLGGGKAEAHGPG